MNHTHRRTDEDARDDAGFTLLELLVVVAVLGILAAIAVPSYLGARERAWMTAAGSDARNGALLVQAALFEGPGHLDAEPLSVQTDFRRSPDVGTAVRRVDVGSVTFNNGGNSTVGGGNGNGGGGFTTLEAPAGYCVAAYHRQANAFALWDSVEGPVVIEGNRLKRKHTRVLVAITSPCSRVVDPHQVDQLNSLTKVAKSAVRLV